MKNKYGIHLKSLKPGSWLVIERKDTGDEVGLFVGWPIDRSSLLKGDQGISVFFPNDKKLLSHVRYSQVKKIGHSIEVPLLSDIRLQR